MSDFNYDGVHNLERDNPGQIEFNRRKNVEQDQRLSTLTSQVNELITQVPAGFLPRLYYALTRGEQKFRFIIDQEFGVENIPGNIGDAFELVSPMESQNYIPAVATKISATAIKIIIQGDYNLNVDDFDLINMATGDILSVTLPNALALQNASYLGDFDAQNSKGKQVTVLYDIETNEQNVIFASVDFSGDGIYNWIRIGGYVNGVSGKNIFGVTLANIEAVSHVAIIGDLLLAGTQFNYGNISFNIGDLAEVTGVNPLSIVYRGNIRGEQGAQGPAGATGATGQNGLTPRILNGTWWLGDEDTGVVAQGQNGTNGQDGQSFMIASGLFSAPANLNNPNNIGPAGETLQQLPTLPSSDISGKAYIVFDPITTPLNPYYDLYFANDGDQNWTILHPFSGIKGQDGTNGFTPYIQGNNWYINGQNTGVSATGPQGPQGDRGLNPMGNWVAENEYFVDDLVTYNGSSYLCINNHSGVITPPNTDALNWLLFTAKGETGSQGPAGATGATGPTGPAGATGAPGPAGEAIIINSPATATNGVISLENVAKLQAFVYNYIVFNGENYYLNGNGHTAGYLTYSNIEYENNVMTVKTITITISTGGWVLNELSPASVDSLDNREQSEILYDRYDPAKDWGYSGGIPDATTITRDFSKYKKLIFYTTGYPTGTSLIVDTSAIRDNTGNEIDASICRYILYDSNSGFFAYVFRITMPLNLSSFHVSTTRMHLGSGTIIGEGTISKIEGIY